MNVKFAIGENICYNNKGLLKTKEGDLYFKKKDILSCKKISKMYKYILFIINKYNCNISF